MSSRKKKTKKQSSEVTPNPSLPDDLLLSCFARLSKMYYPTLSLVSKSCRSLIASREIYKTRSIIKHTESCLYICLQFPDEPNQRWFTLCRKPPNQTQTNKKKKKKSSGALVPVPVPNSPTVHCKGLVAVGSDIYAIGGSKRKEYSSSVSILDCRSHTWHEAPNMQIERNCAAAANVVDGRIYVAGGSQDYNHSNKMEVFDTKTQTWELVVSPLAERCMNRIYNSAVIDGKIYLFGYKGVAYKPKEAKWIAIPEEHNCDFGLSCHFYCVVDNVMYCYDTAIHWYDFEERDWNELKGLKGLPKFPNYSNVKLAACGGKLVVLWDKNVPASGYKEKMIWCAEISLEKRDNEDIWGKVEWFDAVLTVPKSYKFVSTLAATV